MDERPQSLLRDDEGFGCARRFRRQPEDAGRHIGRTRGDDAERRTAAGDPVDHMVHDAVAPHGHDGEEPVGGCLGGRVTRFGLCRGPRRHNVVRRAEHANHGTVEGSCEG